MKYLDYYFQVEFQFKSNKWLNPEGFNRVKIRGNIDLLKNEYVDYSILERFIILDNRFKKAGTTKEFIKSLEDRLELHGVVKVGNEGILLELKEDYCKIIDCFCSEDGKEAPLSWNIETPEHLQFVPTKEIFQLFYDWLDFLEVVEKAQPRVL